MKTTINKTVLTLTAFMSVNSVFANTLPPTFDCSKQVAQAESSVKETKKAIANSLPPTPEKGVITMQAKRAIANSLPPCPEGWNKPFDTQLFKMLKMSTQRVNMG